MMREIHMPQIFELSCVQLHTPQLGEIVKAVA